MRSVGRCHQPLPADQVNFQREPCTGSVVASLRATESSCGSVMATCASARKAKDMHGDPTEPENHLEQAPPRVAALIQADAAAWLRTRKRAPE